jgi:hypothetical protein
MPLALTKPITPLRTPIVTKPTGVTVVTTSYWYESGVLWMVSSDPTVLPQLVGFGNYAAITQYCSGSSATLITNTYGQVYTTWTSQDFPALVVSAGLLIFATQFSASFAPTFIYDLEAAVGLAASAPGALTTIIPWTQAASLSVQGPSGTQTISLTYQAVCTTANAQSNIVTSWL